MQMNLKILRPMTFAARRRRSSVLYISDALVNPHAGARCRRSSTVGGAGCALKSLPEDGASPLPALSNGAGRRRRSSVIAGGVVSAAHGVANGGFAAPEAPPSALMEEEEEEEAAEENSSSRY